MSKYSMLVQWSEDDKAFVATVPELPGLSAFGSTSEKAVKELTIAQKLFLEVLREDGDEVPEPELLKPYSGQTRLRLPKSLHASLANEAKKEEVSLNTFILYLLSKRNAAAMVERKIEELSNRVSNYMLSNFPEAKAGASEEHRQVRREFIYEKGFEFLQ